MELVSLPRRLAGPTVLLALVLPTTLPAQDSFPLRVVEFEGNDRFAAEQLMPVTGLEVGRPVTKKDFDQALRRLNETGVFEGLRYRFEPHGDGYKLTIAVQEVPELFPVRFDGFDVPAESVAEVLRERLPLYVGLVPGGGPAVRVMVNVLQRWWAERGGDEKVVADLVPAADSGFEMLVGPERETSNIAFVRFDNTGDVDGLELQRVFNQSAMGEPYSEARLKELLHYNARPFYTELGYMNVSFCPCETFPDRDSAGLIVNVLVEQGEEYSFGEVDWPDPLPIDPESLRKVNQIESGQVVNMRAAYATMADIAEGMQRQGYMKASAVFDERVDHDNRRVHLDIRIDPGLQFVFSRLIVKGLDILSEPTIRKRWGMERDAPFDVRYPAYFLDRVKADAMFENLKRTSWSIETDDTTGRVDVTLFFWGLAAESPLDDRDEDLRPPFD